MKYFINSRYNSNNQNILSRIPNTFATALNKNKILPKYVVVVLDNDLVNALQYENYGITSMIGSWFEWLAKEIDEMITTTKGQLPIKAKRDGFPVVFWVAPPHHKLFSGPGLQSKTTLCLALVLKT